MLQLLRTKIVCTIGPASREPELLAALIEAGMDVARLNFSHGEQAFHAETIARIRAASAAAGKPVAILGDLQGPKLRVGIMQEGGVPIAEGETLALTTDHITGTPGRVPVQYELLPEVVEPGDRILIDDGLLELVVTAVEGPEITTRVVTGGILNSNKGLNLPRAALSIPAITEKDREDLAFAVEQGLDWIALSFVRTAEEVLDLKGYIRTLSAFGHQTPVMAKIEKPEAIQNIDAIIAAADGDHGGARRPGHRDVPRRRADAAEDDHRQVQRAGQAGGHGHPDARLDDPQPAAHRAEASDVANAILDGSDAIMLSGETASGKYPLEAVRTMARITAVVEQEQCAKCAVRMDAKPGRTFAEAVAHASVETAIDLSATAIVAPSMSGHTARTISKFRPPCPIVAVTPSPFVQRELCIFWGVYPLLSQRAATTDAVINDAVEKAQQAGFVGEGDVVVVTGGSVEGAGNTTNLMKVHLIERVLAHGLGLGDRKVIGRARAAGGAGVRRRAGRAGRDRRDVAHRPELPARAAALRRAGDIGRAARRARPPGRAGVGVTRDRWHP